ncbi:14394_t:CDS:2 [Acaulospora colombiana]|uniref:14394_t:CDS:1 n=1 Tax=Acaulospora colombiana TaxID=27376 RepID=A0ACA9MBC8_9GLOM|nr:14394_t:CDS:2 [Acaulospora colombiana]
MLLSFATFGKTYSQSFQRPLGTCSHYFYHSTSQAFTVRETSNPSTTKVYEKNENDKAKETDSSDSVTTQPFPMNPYFKAQPPLSDNFKEMVWSMFVQGNNTREIGTKMGISLKRVEAILKLKKLERDMIAQGMTIQKNFTTHMEKMLGARSILSEKPSDTYPQVGRPKFHLADEGEAFKPEDAAKILKRPPLALLEERKLKEELLRPFTLEEKIKQPQNTVEIRHDKEFTNKRFAFKFKNVGKNPGIVIRERDGRLLKTDDVPLGKSIHFTD